MIGWVDGLVMEYEHYRKELTKQKSNLIQTNDYSKDDILLINSMITSMTFSIDWMKEGKQPGTFGGIDEKRKYQRMLIEDMDKIPYEQIEVVDRELTSREKRMIKEKLILLSERERQCFLLHVGEEMTMQQVADELKISRSTVQTHIERARNKLKPNKVCRTKSTTLRG